MQAPVRYARLGDMHVGYRHFDAATGDLDVVQVPNWMTHCEHFETVEPLGRWVRRMASFTRYLYFDMPGSGLSDPIADDRPPTVEQYAECIAAVMDDARLDRAWVLGLDYGCQAATMFAATHPERVQGLILFMPIVKSTRDSEFPDGFDDETLETLSDSLSSIWATDTYIDRLVPGASDTPLLREQLKRLMRSARSPGSASRVLRTVLHTDVSHVLATIRVPTLVVSPRDNPVFPETFGRFVADRIPDATFTELSMEGAMPVSDAEVDGLADEVQAFITGVRSDIGPHDRQLATVVFTDIVASTQHASLLGDERWRDLIEQHDAIVRSHVELHRGRFVRSTGDGALATFDGPARAIRFATSVVEAVRSLGIEIRAGIHTGEIDRGPGDEIGGLAVHISSRVTDQAAAGEVLTSHAVPPLVVGSGITFVERGSRPLKGVPGAWTLWAVATDHHGDERRSLAG